MLQAINVSLQYGARVLFKDVTLKFTKGNCYGVIGANGAGKSTFLKILSGKLEPNKGEVILDKNERLSVLNQDQYAFDNETIIRTVLMGNKRLVDIMDEKDALYNKADFTEGLFEKLYNNFPEENKHRLSIQYRMHPVIGSLISKVFYENEIQNGTPKEARNTGIFDYDDVAIEWITTSKLSSIKRYEKRVGDETNATYKNDSEISIIKAKLRELDISANRVIKVGVITAYRAQKSAIKDMVKQQSFRCLQVEVDTVDAFQGGQKEIIIYSTVRSSSNAHRIGFLKSEARLNVSLSRAQSLLIIVGDLDFLNNSQIQGNKFPEIIEYINQAKGCRITEAVE